MLLRTEKATRHRARWLPVLVALGVVACGAPSLSGDGDNSGPDGGGDGQHGPDDGTGPDGGGGKDGGGSGAGSSSGSGSGAGNGTGSGATDGNGGGAGSSGTAPSLMPARIRRLTNAEYNVSVKELLGTDVNAAAAFPPDARQYGYTVNEAQRVDPLLALELDTIATELAAEARPRFNALAPCSNPGQDAQTCAASFIQSFGSKAYRRALTEDDSASLLTLYQAGAEGASYEDGIELVIRGLLQSPGFLYITELGEGSSGETVTLTAHETASELAYVFRGGPPDQELLDAAANGSLLTPEGREAQVRRLFQTPEGRARAIQIVREWIGIDRILQTGKDTTFYPDFTDALRTGYWNETDAFVRGILDSSGGKVSDLLGSTMNVAQAPVSDLYQKQGGPARRGLLNQGAFLSVFAHANESAPVMRGVTVLRKVACFQVPSPTALTVQIVPPLPDPQKTTRERYAIHSTDEQCAQCHFLIDPIGFSFEGFDGIGAFRTTENNPPIPVDSEVEIDVSVDFDGKYADSNELAARLAESETVRDCFGTQVFRSLVGEGQNSSGYERSFAQIVSGLPPESRGTLIELMVAFARSPLFVERRIP